MLRSIVLGVLGTLATAAVVGIFIGYFLVPDHLYKEGVSAIARHNEVIAHLHVQIAILGGWMVAALLGGVIAGHVNQRARFAASFYTGLVTVVLLLIPVAIIGPSNLSVLHIATVGAILPASIVGGVIAAVRLQVRKIRDTGNKNGRIV